MLKNTFMESKKELYKDAIDYQNRHYKPVKNCLSCKNFLPFDLKEPAYIDKKSFIVKSKELIYKECKAALVSPLYDCVCKDFEHYQYDENNLFNIKP